MLRFSNSSEAAEQAILRERFGTCSPHYISPSELTPDAAYERTDCSPVHHFFVKVEFTGIMRPHTLLLFVKLLMEKGKSTDSELPPGLRRQCPPKVPPNKHKIPHIFTVTLDLV